MTVRVALDVHALQVPGYADRGIGRYVAGYARALNRRAAVAAALLAPELPPPAGLPGELVAAGLARWDGRDTCRTLLSEGGPPPVYHVTAPFLHCGPGEPAALGVVDHWARAAVPRVVLLHDLIPLRAPRHYLPSAALEERYRARAQWVAGSDLIVTNSEYTRLEAIELLQMDPAVVATVGAGVSSYFSPPDGTDEELWQFHLRALAGRPYVMTVGGSDVRKGTDRAIAAFAEAVRGGLDLALVVVGHLTDRWRADLGLVARACGVEDRVVFLGAVDDELLRACYRRAVLTLMPSLAEGAGLPVLESAACGTPALASATTALSETAAVPEALFDPADTDDIADAMAAVVRDPARQARILVAQQAVAATSSWDAVAERAVRALSSLAGGRSSLAGGRSSLAGGRSSLAGGRSEGWSALPRWAVVAAPARPGPGVDPADVAAALEASGRAEVTCVGFRPARPGTPPVALGAFGTDVRPASFDHVVYRIGGETAGPIGRLAGRFPGWVWLEELPAAARLAELAASARGILVTSAALQRAVELLLPPLRPHPPIEVVPTGGPAAGPAAPDPAAPDRAVAGPDAVEEVAEALYRAVNRGSARPATH